MDMKHGKENKSEFQQEGNLLRIIKGYSKDEFSFTFSRCFHDDEIYFLIKFNKMKFFILLK